MFIHSNAASPDQRVLVPITATITKPSPALTVSPTSLTFNAQENGPLPSSQSFSVSNTGHSGSVLHYRIAGGASWLHVAGPRPEIWLPARMQAQPSRL